MQCDTVCILRAIDMNSMGKSRSPRRRGSIIAFGSGE